MTILITNGLRVTATRGPETRQEAHYDPEEFWRAVSYLTGTGWKVLVSRA